MATVNLFSEHTTDRDEPLDDYELQREHILSQIPPNSWVEDGVRHVYVWDESIELRYSYKDGKLFKLREETF